MHINIELKQKDGEIDQIPFKIRLKELKDAIEDCYMALGTPYDPIKIDNFVTISEENSFSLIDKKTKILISLKADSGDNLSTIIDYSLVCCKIKNVGKAFLNHNNLLTNSWKEIFKYKKEHICNAPDGTLYVSPNKNKKCVITVKETDVENILSYSILISMNIEFEQQKTRRYYLMLDPLVKVSSGIGTKPPVGDS